MGGAELQHQMQKAHKKWRLRAVLLVEARSESYAGVIYDVASVRLVDADQEMEQNINNPREAR